MLGAGFVTKPTLDILAKSGVTVSVGTADRLLPPGLAAQAPADLLLRSLPNPRDG